MSGQRPLKAVGRALHVSHSGALIVKLTAPVQAGALLLDEEGRPVGRVVSLMGPVAAPYASVRVMTDRVKRVLGRHVYLKAEGAQG